MSNGFSGGEIRFENGTRRILEWMRTVVARRPQCVHEFLRGLHDVLEGLADDAVLVALIERDFQDCDFWWFDQWTPGIWFDPGAISWEPRLVFGCFDSNFPESVGVFFFEQRVQQISAVAAFAAEELP